MAGFWKAPRELARMRAEGKLTARAYELLHFLAESGADRPGGIVTSVGSLTDVLGGSDATMRRTLRVLRALGLIAYGDHSGRAIFVVEITPALAALADEPRSQPRSKLGPDLTDPLTEVREETSKRDRGSGASKPALIKAAKASPASDVTEAEIGPETETETETPFGGTLARPAPLLPSPPELTPDMGCRELVAYYVHLHAAESGEPATRSLKGQVGRQARTMLDEGTTPLAVAGAIRLLVERRLHPSTLPSLVLEAVAGPRRDREDIAARLRRQAIELRRQEEGEA